MASMFNGATAFTNQNLSTWNIGAVAAHTYFSAGLGAGIIEPNWVLTRPELDTLITNYTDAYNVNTASQATADAAQLIINANTSAITDMNRLFLNEGTFNLDISAWDTSSVTDMSFMFANATVFNQNIGGWNTSSVMDMSKMFTYAAAFNQNIGGWNTSSVMDMSNMFTYAAAFNQVIIAWDVGAVHANHIDFATGAGIGITEPIWVP